MLKTNDEHEDAKAKLLALIDHECRNGASEEIADEIKWLAMQIEYYETWKGDFE